MEKGYINIDENEINDISSFLSRNEKHIVDVADTSIGKFSSLKRSSLFGNGIDKINKQLSSIANSVSNINKTVKYETSGMMELDQRLAKKADAIEIPMDFVTNNSVRQVSFANINLNKSDGKSINKDSSLPFSSASFESTVSRVELDNINNSTNVRDVNNISINNTNFKNVKLGSIGNDSDLGMVELKQNANINKQTLRDIESDSNIQDVVIADDTLIENVMLSNINERNILNGDKNGFES